jgi:hypothetical protein
LCAVKSEIVIKFLIQSFVIVITILL